LLIEEYRAQLANLLQGAAIPTEEEVLKLLRSKAGHRGWLEWKREWNREMRRRSQERKRRPGLA
jgi:hypothetical protein